MLLVDDVKHEVCRGLRALVGTWATAWALISDTDKHEACGQWHELPGRAAATSPDQSGSFQQATHSTRLKLSWASAITTNAFSATIGSGGSIRRSGLAMRAAAGSAQLSLLTAMAVPEIATKGPK